MENGKRNLLGKETDDDRRIFARNGSFVDWIRRSRSGDDLDVLYFVK